MIKCIICGKPAKEEFKWDKWYACSQPCLEVLKDFCMEFCLTELEEYKGDDRYKDFFDNFDKED